MDHTISSTAGTITGVPYVTLVDIDGYAVPVGEKDIPEVTPDPTDPADWPAWCDDWYWTATEDIDVPPVAGGSPEAYEPTAEDMEDYRQWAAELDARRDQEEFYRRHPIAEFNAIRAD